MSAQVAERRHPADLEPIANGWQRALDADYRALNAVEGILPSGIISAKRYSLARERQDTELLLARLAHTTGAHPVPWLAALPVTNHVLGLPDTVEGCIFDLDGVLTDSGLLHARAWAKTFDPLLQELAEKTGWQFIPFDRGAGLPRLPRRKAEARGSARLSRQPWDPPARGPARGRCTG